MSLRIDDDEWISGALLIGETGLGVAAETIPSTGADGASYLYNDLDLPADNGKEICGRITSWPTAGTLYAYEDGSFGFTDAPDGAYSFDYQLYVDGIATGSPTTVSLTVGVLTLRPGLLTNTSTFYAAGVQAGDVSVLPGLLTNTNLFFAPTVANGSSNFTPEQLAEINALIEAAMPTPEEIATAVWAAATRSLTQDIAAQVLAAATTTPIASNIEKVNGVTIIGTGVTGDSMRPA